MIRKLNPQTILLIALLCILAVRLVSLPMYPLMDTTEARYAEMSRKMLETGNWVTPLYDYDVPFWGKPPLSFWAGAVTMKIFGINEFGARVAPFIASILTGLLFFAWPFKENRREKALLCFIVMQSTIIGFVGAGAVMTDEYLLLATALCMVSFWKAMLAETKSRLWGYLFFVGLALGLLAKGPLIFVLAGFPIFWWVAIGKQWLNLWHKLPWLSGIILMLIIAVPWYWAAENATPGFLRYFIIGEHFERFLVKGWQGDLYGSGHGRMKGTIWLYALFCTFPWILLWPYALYKKLFNRAFSENLYLILWMLTPLLFFTFAGNILPAYTLPGLAAFAILTAQAVDNWRQRVPAVKYVSAVPALGLIVLALILFLTPLSGMLFTRSHKELLSHWDGQSRLTYLNKRYYSSQFYSYGKAAVIEGITPEILAAEIFSYSEPQTVAVRKTEYEQYFAERPQWQIVAEQKPKGRWYLVSNFESRAETKPAVAAVKETATVRP